MKRINQRAGSLEEYARGYRYYGFNRDAETGAWTYREWAPAARRVSLIGDFNGWNRESHPLERNERGVWEIMLPPDALAHGQKVKVHVVGADGTGRDRIPAWITRTVQDTTTYDFAGEIWMPERPYEWRNNGFEPSRVEVPFVYEAHVGMGGEEGRVHTYREFADEVLPRISRLGYNTVQLMAVQEHPYYGSFGYHVSSFSPLPPVSASRRT